MTTDLRMRLAIGLVLAMTVASLSLSSNDARAGFFNRDASPAEDNHMKLIAQLDRRGNADRCCGDRRLAPSRPRNACEGQAYGGTNSPRRVSFDHIARGSHVI